MRKRDDRAGKKFKTSTAAKPVASVPDQCAKIWCLKNSFASRIMFNKKTSGAAIANNWQPGF